MEIIQGVVRVGINSLALGLLQALFGELDVTFKAFLRVQDWGSFSTEHIRYFFPDALAPLRKDPRFRQLVAQVNRAWRLPADGSLPDA